jgi:trk system potassium uptake protein TrkH
MAETESLSYSVRPAVVATYFGQIMLLVGALWVVPVAVAAVEGEWTHTALHALAAAAFAGLGWLLGRNGSGADIQLNEALVAVAGVFIATPLVLAFPIMAAGVGFLDALFEAISGITTTGLSTFATVADKPKSLIFTASWLQWIGGIAIIVLSFALLFGQSASAMRLTGVLVGQPTGVVGGTRAYARVVIRIYIGLTAIGVLALMAAGAGWFAALTLTLSGVSTGGFTPYDDSLASAAGAVRAVVIVLCLAGAIAMPLYHQALRGKWRVAAGDPELRALFIAGGAIAALLLLRALAAPPAPAGAGDLVFAALSAQTGAGFSTAPVAALDPFSKAVLIVSMSIGGSVGSTTGGIKLLRVIVLIWIVQRMIRRTRLTPHAAGGGARFAGRDWSDAELLRIVAVSGLFFAVMLVSWLPFLWYGHDPLDSLFEVVSATGTVGLSTGIAGPGLPAALKGVLCVDMLLGRLEVFAILVLLAPRTWTGQRRQPLPVRGRKQRE